jgi:type IV pilus assembly protein PilP
MAAAAVAIGGCGKKSAPPAPQQIVQEEVVQEKPKEQQNYFYTPIGKRDPFRPYFLDVQKVVIRTGTENAGPLEQFELEQLKLVALLTGMDTPMAMVEDPEGKGHTLIPGTIVGKNGGRVARITKDEVLVEEEYYNSEGKRIINKISMKLPREASDK